MEEIKDTGMTSNDLSIGIEPAWDSLGASLEASRGASLESSLAAIAFEC